jgi:hypothetical protein
MTWGTADRGQHDHRIAGGWFNDALLLVKATADQTEGRFAAIEFVAPKGVADRDSTSIFWG